ncbi:MAG: hypothetical protein PHT51_05350 [Patescibacteria group bacterium]|nr:hypothetical protein [Patescibacteria group bacterium]
MTKKKITFSIIAAIAILAIGGSAWYFLSSAQNENNKLNQIKKDYPELAEFTDDIIKENNKLKEDETKIENYFSLGLAWKSLADRANDRKLNDTDYFYKKALDTYETGLNITRRKNTILMMNAADMAINLKNYTLAEEYYKEAISLTPGNASYYVALANLYENYMNKTKEEIIALYDDGLARVIDTNFLQTYKERYLKRIGEIKQ